MKFPKSCCHRAFLWLASPWAVSIHLHFFPYVPVPKVPKGHPTSLVHLVNHVPQCFNIFEKSYPVRYNAAWLARSSMWHMCIIPESVLCFEHLGPCQWPGQLVLIYSLCQCFVPILSCFSVTDPDQAHVHVCPHRTSMPFADPREVLSEKETPMLVKTEPLLTNVLLCQTLSAAIACSHMNDSKFTQLSRMAKSLNPPDIHTLTPLAKIRMVEKLLDRGMKKKE